MTVAALAHVSVRRRVAIRMRTRSTRRRDARDASSASSASCGRSCSRRASSAAVHATAHVRHAAAARARRRVRRDRRRRHRFQGAGDARRAVRDQRRPAPARRRHRGHRDGVLHPRLRRARVRARLRLRARLHVAVRLGVITGGVGPWMPYQMFGCAWVGLLPDCCRRAGARPRSRCWPCTAWSPATSSASCSICSSGRSTVDPVARSPTCPAHRSLTQWHRYLLFDATTSLGLGHRPRHHQPHLHPVDRSRRARHVPARRPARPVPRAGCVPTRHRTPRTGVSAASYRRPAHASSLPPGGYLATATTAALGGLVPRLVASPKCAVAPFAAASQ